jgi:hypothetical protein
VHVDVDQIRRDGELEQERRTHAAGKGRAIRRFGSAYDAMVAHGASIHRDEDPTRPGACVAGSFHQPRDLNRSADAIDLDEPVGDGTAPQGGDPRPQRGRRRHGERLPSIVGDR